MSFQKLVLMVTYVLNYCYMYISGCFQLTRVYMMFASTLFCTVALSASYAITYLLILIGYYYNQCALSLLVHSTLVQLVLEFSNYQVFLVKHFAIYYSTCYCSTYWRISLNTPSLLEQSYFLNQSTIGITVRPFSSVPPQVFHVTCIFKYLQCLS